MNNKLTINEMYDIYKITRSNKRRSEDSVEFEIEFEKYLTTLIKEINERNYTSSGNYTFIVNEPTRNGCREVFAAELAKRIMHHYINEHLNEIMEKVLIANTFNNRKGKGVLKAVNTIKDEIRRVSNNYKNDCWVIKWDLKAYFMCVKHDIINTMIQELIDKNYQDNDKEIIKWVVKEAINANPQNNCYRKSQEWKWDTIEPHKSLFNQPAGQGGAIGFLPWQMFINYYHNEIDHWLTDEEKFSFVRFVDDMLIITDNKEYVLNKIIPELRERYKKYNITIQERKFYCQHYSKGVKFCGVTIKYDRLYPNHRVICNMHNKIKRFNKITYKFNLHVMDFCNTLNSYFGLMNHMNAMNVIYQAISMINIKWWDYMQWNPDRKIVEPKPHLDFLHQLGEKYGIDMFDDIHSKRKRKKRKKKYFTDSHQKLIYKKLKK